MGGVAIIVVGMPGSGKTTWTKERLRNAYTGSLRIYDVNNEYTEFHKQKKLPDYRDFLSGCTKLSNAVIVVEEATIFVSNKGITEDFKNILVRRRHTNNMFFLMFHALRMVPKDIYDLCNYVVIHKTKDNESLIEKRFEDEDFTQAFMRIKNAAWIQGKTKKYSPHEVYNLYKHDE